MPTTTVSAGSSEVDAAPGYVGLSAHDDSSCGCGWSDKSDFEAFLAGMILAGRIAFGNITVTIRNSAP